MADPMWSGGIEQFQDRYPWVWNIMSSWMQAPFYPTDPPRDPGAFADSVIPLADFPVLGGFYAYFVVHYCEDYATAWYASPPGSSSSTPVPIDVPANYTQSYDQPYSNYYLKTQHDTHFGDLETSLGYDASETVHDKLDAILAAINGLPEPPSGFSTTSDAVRILAAVAFIGRQLCALGPALSAIATAEDIDAAVVSIKGPHDTSNSSNWDAIFDETWGAIRAINDNTSGVETSINGNVNAAEESILGAVAALAEGLTGAAGGYPGSDLVTLGSPVAFSIPAQIEQAMDGCLVAITTQVGGTGHHDVGDFTSWQHAGWLAFIDDQGHGDELQWLNLNQANYCPKRLASASGVLIFPRAGSSGTLTPWTRNA